MIEWRWRAARLGSYLLLSGTVASPGVVATYCQNIQPFQTDLAEREPARHPDVDRR